MFAGKKKILTNEELAAAVKSAARKFFGGKSGSHDWDHSVRVLENCKILGNKLGADLFVLELATYLHDIGRKEEVKTGGRVCHAQKGAQAARKILAKLGCEKNLADAVIHCVECHRSKDEKKPVSIEAKVLFDADKLDALGAIGIVRLFLFANEVGAGIHNQESDLAKTRAYSQEDTAFREFYLSVRHLKDKMITEPGRELALERHNFMVSFFENLFQEIAAKETFWEMLKKAK